MSCLQNLQRLTLKKAWNYLRNGLWFTDSTLLLVRPAGAPVNPVPSKPCTGEIRLATESDLPDCASFEDAAHYVPIYRDMLRRGDLVLFGYLDSRCVFRCCLQRNSMVTFAGHPVRSLAAEEGYVHYVLCAPWARKKGFHEAALRRLCLICLDHALYAEVKEDNIPSLRGFYRNSFRPAARLRARNCFFHRTFSEVPFSNAEADALIKRTLSQSSSVYIDKDAAPPLI